LSDWFNYSYCFSL